MHSASDNAVIMYISRVYILKVYLQLYGGFFPFCFLRSCVNNLSGKIITVKPVLAAAETCFTPDA